MVAHAHEEAQREKRTAALGSVGSAILLVGLKIYLTIATGSLGVLSEALHSSLDLVAAVITYLSVRVSDRPADANHTYGHGKVENFSAFVETGLLLLTALYIIWEAIQRLFFHSVHIQPSLLAVGILGIGLVIDVVRSRALDRAAKKFNSEALEADALHFSTDVWSTTVVIAGLVAVWVGERFGIPWLSYADPLAALVVAGVVIWVGSRLGIKTMDALLDAAPLGLQDDIDRAARGVDGVLDVSRVRVRRAGNHHFVDVTISVPRTHTFDQVHAVSDNVEKRIQARIPSDVVVHMEPQAHEGEGLFDVVRALAQRRGLAIHELAAHQRDGRVFLEMHLEVDEILTLREAHRKATELEQDVLREAPEVSDVNIHIEPLGAHIAEANEDRGLSSQIQAYMNSLRAEFPSLMDCHQVYVRVADEKLAVSCHCAMDGGQPITVIHDVTAALEDRVKGRFANVATVTIHPEPPEES